MKRNRLAVALLLLGYGAHVCAQQPPPAPSPSTPPGSPGAGTAGTTPEDLGYVGAMTRIGIGYDEVTHLRGELYRVITESDTSSLLGEAWVSRHAGGLKFSYNWLPEPWKPGTDPTVRKFFLAADRNNEGDAKVTVGGGIERARFFGGLYGSAAVTGRREISDTTASTTTTIQGDDGRPFLQDITTSVRTRIFERPYDYGIGARVGHFYEPALLRLTVGGDYEWGRDSARQTTISAGLEKFFPGAPYSVALNVEHARQSGGFEPRHSDTRWMAMLRYEFGGPVFRPARESRMVEVAPKAAPVPTAPPAASTASSAPAVAAAPTPPRKETRIVKTTASMLSDAFFEFDKSALTPAARAALDGVIARIRKSGFEGNILVTGHTCDIGTAKYNQGLSERRANAVRNYLVANGGLQPGVIIAEGHGLRNPKYPNTRAERYKNRRVDLEFVTYEDKTEDFTVPGEPAPAPAPAQVVTAPPAVTPAPVEWKREVLEKEPPWLRRALRQSLPHKQTVDVYRQREQETTVTQGDKRYINRPPVAANDAFSVAFNSSANQLDVLANDSDPDGDALTITSVGAPTHGTAAVSGGKISYTPTSGFSGADTFTYAVSDGKGGTASASVTVTVQGPVNHPPVAQNDAYTVDQNSSGNALNVLANDSDPDGDSLSIASVAAPGHGTATIANGKVNYAPTAGFVGSDSFAYTVSDGKGGTATATVTITVQAVAVNQPPVAQNDVYTVEQNSSANVLNVLANDSDPDGDALTIANAGSPAHGTVAIASNKLSYTPAAGYSGPDTFTYSISDGKGGTATATVTITVNPPAVNHSPVAVNDAYTVDQNSSGNQLNVLGNDSDPDGDALTITTVGAPAHGVATIAGNRIVYTPSAGYVGTDSFSYSIADGRGGTASATVAITVSRPAGVNNPPVARDDAYFVHDKLTDLDVLANDSDPDGDSLTIVSVTQPPFGRVDINPGGKSVRYTLPFMFNRTSFTYTISDGRGGTATATVTLTDP